MRITAARFEPSGSPGLRRITAVAALACGVATAATSVAITVEEWRRLGVLAGVGALVTLAATVLARANLLPYAVAALAGGAALTVAGRDDDVAAIVVLAALVVATAELASWSIDLRTVVPESPPNTARRSATIAVTVFGSAVVAAGVLAVGGLPAPGGALPELVGLGAGLAIVGFLTLRRWND